MILLFYIFYKMFPENHKKKWSEYDINYLNKEIQNNKCITEGLIKEIANSLKRTKDSIKYKIIFTHIINEFDVNKDSTDILYKYEFIQSEDLVNKILTKKKNKILFYANDSIFQLNKKNIDVDNVVLNINKIKSLL